MLTPANPDQIYEQFGIPAELQSEKDYFFDESPDGEWYPIPRVADPNHHETPLEKRADTWSITPDYVSVAESALLEGVVLGKFIRISPGTTVRDTAIEDHVSLGMHVSIGRGTKLRGTEIGDDTRIGEDNTISDSRIGMRCEIGGHNTIQTSTVENLCSLDYDITMRESFADTSSIVRSGARIIKSALGKRAHILPNVHLTDTEIGHYTHIGEGSILRLTRTGKRVLIGRKALIDCSKIEDKAKIGENTRVQPSVHINEAAVVGDDAYICTEAKVGQEAAVESGVYIEPKVSVGEGAEIRKNSYIEKAVILGAGACVLEGTRVRSRQGIGGFIGLKRRIKPGALAGGKPKRDYVQG